MIFTFSGLKSEEWIINKMITKYCSVSGPTFGCGFFEFNKHTQQQKNITTENNKKKKKNFQFDAPLGNIFNYNGHSSRCFVLNKRSCCCCWWCFCCFCCCLHLAWDKTTQFIYAFFIKISFSSLSWMTVLILTKCERIFGASGLLIERFVQHTT